MLGGALLACAGLGWATGSVPVLAVFLPFPLMTTGAGMVLLPGAVEALSFEPAWMATRPCHKLAWLFAFSVGLVAMLAWVFFAIAPQTSA